MTGGPGSLHKLMRCKLEGQEDFTNQWNLGQHQSTQNSSGGREAHAPGLGSSSGVTASSTAKAK